MSSEIQFYREENFKVVDADGFKLEIPEEWEVVRLGNKRYFEVIMGQSPPSSTYNQDGKGLPFLQGSAEFGSMYPKPQLYTIQPMKIAKENDILISVRAPVGDVNIAPFELCIGRGLAAIRVNRSKIEDIYVFYFLTFTKSRLENIGGGSTFKGITKSTLEELKIPLPPLPEQQKIAHVLTTIDKAIEAVDEAIKQAERIKKGLMQELLTKGIRHDKFKVVEADGFKLEIPEEWEVVRLGDVALDFKQGFPSGKRDDNGILQLRMDSIETNGKINPKGGVKVPPPKNVHEYLLKPGDILFNNTNSVDLVGKTALFKGEFEKCVFSNHLTRIRVNTLKLIPEFLLYILLKYWQMRIFKALCNPHVHQAGIKSKDIQNLKIPLPPLHEQRKIAEILSKWDEVIEVKKAKKERLERMKKKVMELLLTGKVRVK